MTRKKIGIYCTAFWGNNNKNRCCRRCHPTPCPLDSGICPASAGQGTDRRTGARAGIPSQSIDPGNVQRNTPTGTRSAWKRAREDPVSLEWAQTAARRRQNHHPRAGLPAGDSGLPGVGRSCQPGLAVAWRVCSPLNEPCIPPVPLLLPSGAFPKANQTTATCEQPRVSGGMAGAGSPGCRGPLSPRPRHCCRDRDCILILLGSRG